MLTIKASVWGRRENGTETEGGHCHSQILPLREGGGAPQGDHPGERKGGGKPQVGLLQHRAD